MQLLLTCATPFESAPLRQHFGMPLLPDGQTCLHRMAFGEIVLLHTGIGMLNTTWHLGRYLLQEAPEMALQFGIAGAFVPGPEVLAVVEVIAETYAELGADSPEGYLDLEKMGFPHFEAKGQRFFNEMKQTRAAMGLFPSVSGITVNRVSGTLAGIEALQQNWPAEVESMEGAAFFQACLRSNIPFREIRAISNRVEPRNKANWKMKEAIEIVNSALIRLLEDPQMFNLL